MNDASADDTLLQFADGSFQHSGPGPEFIGKGLQPSLALMIFVFAALFAVFLVASQGTLGGSMAASRCTEYDDVGEPCIWGNVGTCGMESSAVVDGRAAWEERTDDLGRPVESLEAFKGVDRGRLGMTDGTAPPLYDSRG